MPVNDLSAALAGAVAEVLENMFFTGVLGETGPAALPDCPSVSASLAFHGDPSGRFGVRLLLDDARKIAASFLGEEEESLTELQVGEVVCELANMLCGSVVSRFETDSRFELSQPVVDPPDFAPPKDPAACGAYELEEGFLSLWLDLE
jgi:CheY-specific phosphatase CheX